MKTATQIHEESMKLVLTNSEYVEKIEEMQKGNQELLEKIKSTREEINRLQKGV